MGTTENTVVAAGRAAAREGLKAGPKVPQASPEERAAYVQGKVIEALDTYRPSYQRKILERCIAELPADTDDDEQDNDPTGYTKEKGEELDAAYGALADSVIHWPLERIHWLANRIEELGSEAPEATDEVLFGGDRAAQIQEVSGKLATCDDELFDLVCRTIQTVCDREANAQDGETADPDEPTEADNNPQGVDDEAGELIEQICDLLERTDNDFKASIVTGLRKREGQRGKTMNDSGELTADADDETCFDAAVQWLRSQSREAKLTAVLLNVLLSHEHVLPGKHIGNVLYREFEAESLASDDGDFGFVAAYTAGMMAVPC